MVKTKGSLLECMHMMTAFALALNLALALPPLSLSFLLTLSRFPPLSLSLSVSLYRSLSWALLNHFATVWEITEIRYTDQNICKN